MAEDESSFEALLNDIALAVFLARATDDATFTEIGVQARELEKKIDASHSERTRGLVAECNALVAEIPRTPAAGRPVKLNALGAIVKQLQASLHPVPEAKVEAASAAIVRDAETIELINDFLTESTEAIAKADEILMSIEQDGLNAEDVNALFRVFHTIKGVAGFLDFHNIIALAHTTETLLDRVREGRIDLDGARLERVFDATTMMQQLLARVRSALETGTEIGNVDLSLLLAGIELALAGDGPRPAPKAVVARPAPEVVVEAPAVVVEAPAVVVPAPRPAARQEEASEADDDAPDEPARAAPRDAEGGQARGRSPGDAPAAMAIAPKLRETLKVDVDRVEKFVEMVGELIIVQSMVVHAPEIASLQSLRLQGSLSQLSKISRDLQDVAMRMRMVPVRGLFKKLARMVRELSRKVGKDVVLQTSGEGAEMDRSMVERLEEPLVHMIRNSIDHGIEDAEARAKTTKMPSATIRLSAYHAGGSVVVEIADDGKGLNREAILKKAKQNGLIREGEILPDADVYNMIFAPGFSTAAKVTEISGRGVGMDVVKRNIEAMRGRVQIASTSPQGTLFKIVLPLTMAIIDGMLIACGKEVYILPSLLIVESFQPTKAMLFTMSERDELVSVRGELLPLIRLSRVFHIDGAQEDPTQALVVVVESLGRKVALVVDDVIDEQQVVIKSLDAGISGADFFTGAAILSDGRVGLILNVDRIGSMAGPDTQAPARKRAVAEAAS
jgi:two-component system chemotaxis sensor kinase CheA